MAKYKASGGITVPAVLDGTGLTSAVPLTIKNAKNLSGIEVQVTGTAPSGFILNDSAGTRKGEFGYVVTNADWATGTIATDVVLLAEGAGAGVKIKSLGSGGVHIASDGNNFNTTTAGYFKATSGGGTFIGYGVNQISFSSTAMTSMSGTWSINTSQNIMTSDANGLKISSATSQKVAVFNVTPVVQPNTTGETVGFTAGAGTAVTDQSTFTGNVGATAYRISDIVKALKNTGWMAQ